MPVDEFAHALDEREMGVRAAGGHGQHGIHSFGVNEG
jgi:hypothetical protein